MTNPTLLIVYFSGYSRTADESETKEAVATLRNFVRDLDVINEQWDTALKRLWDYNGDIIVMEHDVVPTISMAVSMLNCSCIWGTQRYRLYSPTTFFSYECYGDRYLEADGKTLKLRLPTDPPPEPEYCDAASLCFTKFTYEFRRQIKVKELFIFEKYSKLDDLRDLDDRISRFAMNLKIKCHVHYPEMKHNHKTIKNEWIL